MEKKDANLAPIIISVVSMICLVIIIFTAYIMISRKHFLQLPLGETALCIIGLGLWILEQVYFVPYFLVARKRCLPHMYDGIDIGDQDRDWLHYVPFFNENTQYDTSSKFEAFIYYSGFVSWGAFILWVILSLTKFQFLHDILGGFAFTVYNEKAYLLVIWFILLVVPKGIGYCVDMYTQTEFFDYNFDLDEAFTSKGTVVLCYIMAFIPIARIVYYYFAAQQYNSLFDEILQSGQVRENFEEDAESSTSQFK